MKLIHIINISTCRRYTWLIEFELLVWNVHIITKTKTENDDKNQNKSANKINYSA